MYNAERNGSIFVRRALKLLSKNLERTLPHKVHGLYYLYTIAQSMRNKHNYLKLLIQEQNAI